MGEDEAALPRTFADFPTRATGPTSLLSSHDERKDGEIKMRDEERESEDVVIVKSERA